MKLPSYHSHRFKMIGIQITVISVIVMLLISLTDSFRISDNMTSLEQINLTILIACLGLFMIAYSEEKHETEETTRLRDRTFRVTFGFLLALLISNSFTTILFGLNSPSYSISNMVPLDVAIALCFHLVIYYYGKYTLQRRETN